MNKADCDEIIEGALNAALIPKGYVKQEKAIWIKETGPNGCFEAFGVHLGKYGFSFSFGVGSLVVPVWKGSTDIHLQKPGKVAPNLHMDYSSKALKDDGLQILWFPGSGMDISNEMVADRISKITKLSRDDQGINTSINALKSIFNAEKDKWHHGLPFYGFVNNLIMEYVFTKGASKMAKESLNEIYHGEKWMTKADAAIKVIGKAM